MKPLDIDADALSTAFLGNSETRNVCVLDSCGVGYLGSRLMVGGIEPIEVLEISNDSVDQTLNDFEKILNRKAASFFSISYDFGRRLELKSTSSVPGLTESDIFVAQFDTLAVHDYFTGRTFLTGKPRNFDRIEELILESDFDEPTNTTESSIVSNFTRDEYVAAVERIKELIRRGDTYQTNLTQRFEAELAKGLTAETVFERLRHDHPAPFAAFLKRPGSTVVSASPERFFKLNNGTISASPIKGTRKRGITTEQDNFLRHELESSEKDRAENTMIVDLLRNDVGRACEYGSVEVEKLCEIETHPTFHHMVSTITGRLRTNAGIADVIRALFPCGSITGAPKIRTMRIIDELENVPCGLSMGAIGYYIPEKGFDGLTPGFDLSVAIRSMVVKGNQAVFNVGGGITIDSDPAAEYEESMLKAKALFAALGNKI